MNLMKCGGLKMENLYCVNGKGIEKDCSGQCETSRNNYEEKFINLISNTICDYLNVGYGYPKNIVSKLLTSILKKKFNNGRDNIFEQYLHSQLDLMLPQFITELDLPENTKINYMYASHAKFNDVIEAIKFKDKKDKSGY